MTIAQSSILKGAEGRFVDPAKIVHLLGLTEGSKFADFGAGSGAYVLASAPLVGQTGQVYAIDVQKDLLVKLKQTVFDAGHSNTRFLWCDLEKVGGTQLPDATLDRVLISNTLFQLADHYSILMEAHRVLEQFGKLYIIEWSESFKGMGPDAEQIITKERAIELAQSVGFTLEEEFQPGEHHYGLVFNKK